MHDQSNTLTAGTRLASAVGGFEILKVLGEGGFGITYKAELLLNGNLGPVRSGAFFAIKECFLPEHNVRKGTTVTGTEGRFFQKYLRKFERESRLLAGLSHPGICHVQDAFSANGTAYYVMDFYPGGSLDDLIRRSPGGAMTEAEATRYLRRIASALEYLHGKGMAHLDLKPQNIVLKADGEPVLIDFGISKQFDDDGQFRSTDSMGGCTPGYAPLEQANYVAGTGQPHLMDIYALGATFYKMLTGKTPPKAADVLNDGVPLGLLRDRGVSEAAIAMIVKAMEPVKRNRYQSVADMMAALSSEPVSAPDEEVTVIAVERSEPKPKPKKEKTSYGHSKPRRSFELCATRDGRVYYFSQAEWKSMPQSEKSKYTPQGIYVANGNEPFLLDLHDNGKGITWDEAVRQYGYNLPSLEQGIILGRNITNVKSALRTFVGDREPHSFWTRSQKNSLKAWLVAMFPGGVTDVYKNQTFRARAISPVPPSTEGL